MASIRTNVITSGLRGKLGDSLVFKTMRGKTFAMLPARTPDKRKESDAQRGTRVNFRQASGWAQTILLNPEKKAYYQERAKKLKLPNAYTAALTDYMRKATVAKSTCGDTATYVVSKKGFTLQKVSVASPDGMVAPLPDVSVRQLHDRWLVQCKALPEMPSFQLIITDNCERVMFIDAGDIRYL